MTQIEVCQRLTKNLQTYLLLIGLAEKSLTYLPFGFVSSKYDDIYKWITICMYYSTGILKKYCFKLLEYMHKNKIQGWTHFFSTHESILHVASSGAC